MELVKQGAEARIYNTVLFGLDVIVKERFSKAYRHPDLDKTLRTKQFANELRSILKCSKLGLNVATVLYADVPNCKLFMKRINGVTVKEWLNQREGKFTSKECKKLCKNLGKCIATLHGEGGMLLSLLFSLKLFLLAFCCQRYGARRLDNFKFHG